MAPPGLRIAEPVVGEEEERLHGEQERRHRQPGDDAGKDRVEDDPRPGSFAPVAALVRVIADEETGREGEEPEDRLDRDDEQEADPDRDGHADADIGGGDRTAIDDPGHEPEPAPAATPLVPAAPAPPAAAIPGRPSAARPEVSRSVAQLALDPEEPVVLGDPLAARRRAGLDLAGAHRDDEVGDGRIFSLTRAMRHDRRPAGPAGQLDRIDRLAQRPNLVELDEHGVRRVGIDRSLDPLGVRDEQVVADELDAIAEPSGHLLPAGPVILGQAVLERNDRKPIDPVGPEVDQFAGFERPSFLR